MHHSLSDSIRTRIRIGYILILCITLSAPVTDGLCAITFEEATENAGFSYIGESWGSAWGDFDNDGLVDLWVSNHLSPPELFHNRGDGTFENVTNALVPTEILLNHDMHGSAWADFDNDGDLDLLQMVGADIESSGGAGPKLLLVNEGGAFSERASNYNLDLPEGRGRMPLWLDVDNDGWLDVYYSTRAQGQATWKAALFQQRALGFEEVTSAAGVNPSSDLGTNYAMLADVDGVRGLELWAEDNLRFPKSVFKTGSFPLTDIVSNLGTLPNLQITQDAAIADFDGDLDNDIYTVNGPRNSNIVLSEPNVLEGHLGYLKDTERGVRFKTTGDILFDLRWLNKNQWSLADVHIGSSGYSPTRFIPTLSAQDSVNHGIAPHNPGVSTGIYIGYNPAADEWEFLASTPKQMADFVIVSDAEITEFTPIALDITPLATPDNYYIYDDVGYISLFDHINLAPRSSGRSIVAGDFDNDMDLDLYIVSTGPVQNLPNTLYENVNNGTFVQVANGGGAGGTTAGRGDAVAMADYDRDGYLDLFVTNGKSRRPFDEDGPVQLFHNTGSGNHWIQLDLVGVVSNRDGIGARVELTAGGVTQLREQNAGIHARAQNQMRLHFGLGANMQTERLVINWPSGIIQQLDNVAADQILRVVEPAVVINKPPTITPLSDQTLMEDSASDPLMFKVGDLGTMPELVSVSALSSNPSIIPHTGLVLGGIGAERSLIVVPATDSSGGPVTISLTASDGSASTSISFNIMVQPVNDAPLASSDKISTIGGSYVRADIAANDRDIDNALNLASIHVVSEPAYGHVTVNNDGSVTYTTNQNGPLSDVFTYTIDDISGATSNAATVNVQIEPRNDNAGNPPSDEVLRGLGLNPDDPNGDSDDDGISDIDELGDDIENPLDSDSDGIINALEPGEDATDAGVARGLRVTEDTSVTVITGAGESLSALTLESARTTPDGVVLPFGLLSYTTTSPVGGNVIVNILFSHDLPENLALYKLNDSNGRYTELPATTWAHVDTRGVKIYLRDGDPLLDQDGVANGSIVDPIAFGHPTDSYESTTGGGGGCQIRYSKTSQDPTLLILIAVSLLGKNLFRRKDYPTRER